MNYRRDVREANALIDLPASRTAHDEFGCSNELLFHALKYQLEENGMLTDK